MESRLGIVCSRQNDIVLYYVHLSRLDIRPAIERFHQKIAADLRQRSIEQGIKPLAKPTAHLISSSSMPEQQETIPSNSTQAVPQEQQIEQITVKLQQIQQQIQDLDSQKATSKKQRERNYLERTVENLEAFGRLSPGQPVQKDEQIGTIAQLNFSPGGMPEAWVQWEGDTVPLPEQPRLVQPVSIEQFNHQSENPHESINARQSQSAHGEDIGRRAVSRLETSSREARRDRRPDDRPRVQSPLQDPDRTVEPESSTVNQSVKRPAAGLQQLNHSASESVRRLKPTTRTTEAEPRSPRSTVGQTTPGVQRANGNSQQFNERTESLNEHARATAAKLQQSGDNSRQFNERTKSSAERTRESTAESQRTAEQARPRVRINVARASFNRRDAQRSNERIREAYQRQKELTDSVRNLPLEEVAERLGLERDRHDKHKWKDAGHSISITGQQFYDWYADKGGGGAIDLVMHVQSSDFKEAVQWLDSRATAIPNQSVAAPPTPTPSPNVSFQPPEPHEAKWTGVKDYLVNKRGLPETLVD